MFQTDPEGSSSGLNTMLTCRTSCSGRSYFNLTTRSWSGSVDSHSFRSLDPESNGFDVCVCMAQCVSGITCVLISAQPFSLGFQ